MSNQRIFIITRTEGLKPSTIERNFRKAEKLIRASGYDVANPYTQSDDNFSFLKNAYLLIKSPYVHVTSNWKNSSQTRWLYALAKLLHKVMFV